MSASPIKSSVPAATAATTFPVKAKAFLNKHQISLIILAVGAALLITAAATSGHIGSLPDFLATGYKTAGLAIGGVFTGIGAALLIKNSLRPSEIEMREFTLPKEKQIEIEDNSTPELVVENEVLNPQLIISEKAREERVKKIIAENEAEQRKAELEKAYKDNADPLGVTVFKAAPAPKTLLQKVKDTALSWLSNRLPSFW